MASTRFALDAKQIEKLQKAIEGYAGRAGEAIDEVLHTQGANLIKEEITRLLPASGRTWKGKAAAAKTAQPFAQQDVSMGVVVYSKPKYNYLYFPDDGTNTERHIGYRGVPREFMIRGAENQTEKIMDLCIAKLTEKIGE